MTAENESVFTRRVAAAARAAWWTWLVGAILVLVQSGGYLLFAHGQGLREWIACVMGVEAQLFQSVILAFMLVVRVLLVIGLMICIFLSLWARALRRAGEA